MATCLHYGLPSTLKGEGDKQKTLTTLQNLRQHSGEKLILLTKSALKIKASKNKGPIEILSTDYQNPEDGVFYSIVSVTHDQSSNHPSIPVGHIFNSIDEMVLTFSTCLFSIFFSMFSFTHRE